LLVYCDRTAEHAQRMVEVHERLGLTENVHRHQGVIAAMLYLKQEINQIILLKQIEESVV